MSQTENSGQTSGRRFTSKHLIAVALLALAVGIGGTYAFSALTSTSTITVAEPLKISSPSIGPYGQCTVSSDGLTVTCTATIDAANSGIFSATISNAANTAISVTPIGTSNSTDFTWAAGTQFNVPAGGNTPFSLGFSISQSARAGEGITATISFNR